MASQTLSWAILAPSWPHLAAKFAHFAAILGSPRLSKIGQNLPRQPPGHFSSKGRLQDLPDPLQASIFQVSGSIFATFLARFFLGFCFQFLPFSMDFLRRLTEEAQLERKGPAVLAAGVFDKSLHKKCFRKTFLLKKVTPFFFKTVFRKQNLSIRCSYCSGHGSGRCSS